MNSLDASQVFALARNYLSDLRELELYHRDRLLTTCAGHPALVKEYLLGFRELEGSSLSFDASSLAQKCDDIVRVSIASLGEKAHDLLLHLSFWDLPIGFGTALEELLPEIGNQEHFLELKQNALLEKSGPSHYRVQPLIARYFQSLDKKKLEGPRRSLVENSKNSAVNAVSQENLAQRILLGESVEQECEDLFCSLEGVENPNRVIKAIEHNVSNNSLWQDRLRGRLIYETGVLGSVEDCLRVAEDNNFWVRALAARLALIEGDKERAREEISQLIKECEETSLKALLYSTLASALFSLADSRGGKVALEKSHELCLAHGFDDLRALVLVNRNVSSERNSEEQELTSREILNWGGSLYSANQTKLFYRKTEILIEKNQLHEAFAQVQSLLVQGSFRNENQKLAHAFLYGGIVLFLLRRTAESLWTLQRAQEFFSFVGDKSRARLSHRLSLFPLTLMGRVEEARKRLNLLEQSIHPEAKQLEFPFFHALLERLQGNMPVWPEEDGLKDWQKTLLHTLARSKPPLSWPVRYDLNQSQTLNPVNKMENQFAQRLCENLTSVHWTTQGPRIMPMENQDQRTYLTDQFELILDLENEVFLDRERGELKLGRKKNLLALFLMFLQHPGEYLSSEYLFECLWNKRYDSEVDEPVVRMAIN